MGDEITPDPTGGWTSLDMLDTSQWIFLGGPWQQRGDEISPRMQLALRGEKAYDGQRCLNSDDHLALFTSAAYRDFEAEFKFRWDAGHTGAGFVFRARDPNHYYLVHFPACGQVIRAEHFWACISVVDGNGWAKVLRMEIVHGVATELTLWHTARVRATGGEIGLWVDRRPVTPVRDDTFAGPGRIGLEAWGARDAASSFKNVRVRGEPVVGLPWDGSAEPVKPWFLPFPVTATKWDPSNNRSQQQRDSGIVKTPPGHLLMNVGWMDAAKKQVLARSDDDGQSWRPMEALGWPEKYVGASLHVRPDGRLLTLFVENDHITRSESADGGATWSAPEQSVEAPFTPPANQPDIHLHGPGNFVQLKDGALLGFRIGLVPGHGHDGPHNLWEWGTNWAVAYSIRSVDGGQSWSAPVPLNGPPAVGQKYDLCECKSTTQTRDGKVLCLVRPIYSPWMWEVWSDNGGESWGPATSGPFPCYAATAFTTSSGVLLVSGRMPGLGLYASFDDGMSWQAYQIDTGGNWAMGHMCEVSPGLVLYVYMDSYESLIRAQYIRVGDDTIEPVLESSVTAIS